MADIKEGGVWFNMGRIGVGPVNGAGNMLLAHSVFGDKICSSDGVTWTKVYSATGSTWDWYAGMAYGNGVWCILNRKSLNDGMQTFTDIVGGSLQNWQKASTQSIHDTNSLAFGNDIFMTKGPDDYIYTSADGLNWNKKGYVDTTNSGARVMGYNNDGMWIIGGTTMYKSMDNGQTWTTVDSTLGTINSGGEWYGAVYARNNFWVINASVRKVAYSATGGNWKEATTFDCSNFHRNITLYKGKLYVFGQEGTCCHVGTFPSSSIKFTNISNGTINNNTSYEVTEKREFFIEPSQISNTQTGGEYTITFTATNLRLI